MNGTHRGPFLHAAAHAGDALLAEVVLTDTQVRETFKVFITLISLWHVCVAGGWPTRPHLHPVLVWGLGGAAVVQLQQLQSIASTLRKHTSMDGLDIRKRLPILDNISAVC